MIKIWVNWSILPGLEGIVINPLAFLWHGIPYSMFWPWHICFLDAENDEEWDNGREDLSKNQVQLTSSWKYSCWKNENIMMCPKRFWGYLHSLKHTNSPAVRVESLKYSWCFVVIDGKWRSILQLEFVWTSLVKRQHWKRWSSLSSCKIRKNPFKVWHSEIELHSCGTLPFLGKPYFD